MFSGIRSIFKYNDKTGKYEWVEDVDPYKAIDNALPSIVNNIVSKDNNKKQIQIKLGRNPDIYSFSFNKIALSAIKQVK